MLLKIENAMQKCGVKKNCSILVGLSGGADSVALTHALCSLSQKYGFAIYAAHVNHGLRGAEAVRDEEFSREFAQEHGITFFSLRADVGKISKEKGISEELAGREVRYEFFLQLCEKHGIDYVATAHHRNDNAETILMNFMRGSGLRGMGGIKYRRENIIRPLLDCTRSEIEEYCRVNGLSYVTDKTNFEDEYTRNKIRHSLIPMIEEKFNPSVVEALTRNAEIISLEDDFISGETDKAYEKSVKDNAADIAVLDGFHKAVILRVIRKLTEKVCGGTDITQNMILSVYSLMRGNRTGAKTEIMRDFEARIEYGKLVIAKKEVACGEFSYRLGIGETIYIPELNCHVTAEKADIRRNDGAVYFSVPAECSLEIRNRRHGDIFRPSGMSGRKKIKQFMIDKKIPAHKRDYVGLLTVNGEIAWVMGYRQSADFKFNGRGIKVTLS